MANLEFKMNRFKILSLASTLALSVIAGQVTNARISNACTDLFSDFANNTKFDYKTIRLESKSMTSESYWSSIANLRSAPPGVILNFGAGHQFVLDRVLGEGATTIIVRTEDHKVLRIGKLVPNALPGTDLTSFAILQKQLQDAGVPVVKIDLDASHLPDFLVVEEKIILMTLGEMSRNHPRVPLSAEAMTIARKRLQEFARKTWKFVYVGDFNDSQLGYDGQSWFIFDLGLNNAPLKSHLDRRNIFSALNFDGDIVPMVDRDLEAKFTEIITNERHERFEKGEWVDIDKTYFVRKHVGRHSLDLIVDDDKKWPGSGRTRPYKEGQMSTEGSIPKKFLMEWARNNVKLEKDWDDRKALPFRFEKLKAIGASSALYSVSMSGGVKGLLEVPFEIDGDDQLFSSKAPLLKELGVRRSDLDAVGPDYTLYIQK